MAEKQAVTAFGITFNEEVCTEIDEYVRRTGEQWRGSFEFAASTGIETVRHTMANETGQLTEDEGARAKVSLARKYQQFLPPNKRNLAL